MRRVNNITKTTNNRFLNMYELDMQSDTGKHSRYFVASRAEKIEDLKITTRKNKADGVIIYSVYRDVETQEEKLVLIRQYRCPIDDYIYEFPAGLVDAGEDFKTAGRRELKEETGNSHTAAAPRSKSSPVFSFCFPASVISTLPGAPVPAFARFGPKL